MAPVPEFNTSPAGKEVYDPPDVPVWVTSTEPLPQKGVPA